MVTQNEGAAYDLTLVAWLLSKVASLDASWNNSGFTTSLPIVRRNSTSQPRMFSSLNMAPKDQLPGRGVESSFSRGIWAHCYSSFPPRRVSLETLVPPDPLEQE